MKKYYFLCLFPLFCNATYCEQAFNSIGGAGMSGNFYIDWSIGEITLIKTEKVEGFTLTQGLLQGKLEVFETASTITNTKELMSTILAQWGRIFINCLM